MHIKGMKEQLTVPHSPLPHCHFLSLTSFPDLNFFSLLDMDERKSSVHHKIFPAQEEL